MAQRHREFTGVEIEAKKAWVKIKRDAKDFIVTLLVQLPPGHDLESRTKTAIDQAARGRRGEWLRYGRSTRANHQTAWFEVYRLPLRHRELDKAIEETKRWLAKIGYVTITKVDVCFYGDPGLQVGFLQAGKEWQIYCGPDRAAFAKILGVSPLVKSVSLRRASLKIRVADGDLLETLEKIANLHPPM